MASELTVAVLGAGGTIAPAIVQDLAQSEEVREMRLLDLDLPRASSVADAHGLGKAVASTVDARDRDALVGALSGTNVLVNTASYRINLDAMRACVSAGCHYLDLGGLYRLTLEQLELSAEFERAGLLAVLGIGSSPGKTNLMAARGLRDLEGSVRSIDVYAAGRDFSGVDDGVLRPPYAIQTLLDELTLEPVVLRDGQAVEIEPLSDGGRVEFGDPIGEVQTIYTLHSELATFGESFGCREASFRLSLAPAVLERLRELVGASEDEVGDASRSAAPPSNETISVHMVRLASETGPGVTVRAVTRPWSGLGGSIVSTAAPIAAGVRLLARGSLTERGVHPPERCIDADEMFAELETRSCTFSVS